MSLRSFYAPERQGRAFGVWARDYTIALAPNGGGYHIGQDYTTGRQPLEVPAILAGEVVRVRDREEVLGSVVVIRSVWAGMTIYVQYSHLSKERLPGIGQRIGQGERVGRLAAGPNKRTETRANPAVPMSHTEWPGTGWDGIHLHLVISTHPDAGYSKVAGHRTLSAFLNPVPIIASILASAAGGGSRPFDPKEDDMLTQTERNMLQEIYDRVRGALPGKENGREQYPRVLDSGDGNAIVEQINASADATRKHVNTRINDLAGWTRDDAKATRAAVSAIQAAGTDPKLIAEAIAPLIPKGVSTQELLDELVKWITR